jgi:hypothetical protein
MSPEAEAGPSKIAPKSQGPASTKNAGRKRKAGGDGKKGKVFLEDKVCRLLPHNVVYQTDNIGRATVLDGKCYR